MAVNFQTKIEIEHVENIIFDKEQKSLFLTKRKGDVRQIYLPDYTTPHSMWLLIDEISGLGWITPQMLKNIIDYLKFWKLL